MAGMSKRKFYKTDVTVTILSEYPLNIMHLELDQIGELINTGDCSGEVSIGESKPINGRTAAKELMKQGSDPGFFELDEKGRDV